MNDDFLKDFLSTLHLSDSDDDDDGNRNKKQVAGVNYSLPEDGGITEEEVIICAKVLEALSDDRINMHVSEDRFRPIRRYLMRVAKQASATHYNGRSRSEYQLRKAEIVERAGRVKRLKEMDRKRVNNRQMRADRLQKLTQLTLAAPEEVRLLKDTASADNDGTTNSVNALANVASKITKKATTTTTTAEIGNDSDNDEDQDAAEQQERQRREKRETDPVRIERRKRLEQAALDFVDCKDPSDMLRRAESEGYQSDDDDDVLAAFEDEGYLHLPRACYPCKRRFHRLHHFYDQLCPSCARLNWAKRQQTADLRGRVCLVTGARVKIGYECGLRLLRCGATLIATSRFPHDCASRYSKEPDFAEWKDRIHVYGLDLRDLASVVRFCDMVSTRFHRLDVIVNNAAQTVRRPPAYYRHLLKDELLPKHALNDEIRGIIEEDPHVETTTGLPSHVKFTLPAPPPPAAAARSAATIVEEEENDADDNHEQKRDVVFGESVIAGVMNALQPQPRPTTTPTSSIGNRSAVMSQIPLMEEDTHYDTALFPTGHFDVTGQQLDLRSVNSWLLHIDQVEPSELVEVFAINALAPFIINSRLKGLMMQTDAKQKFIINVSAMEGKFYRHKGPEHPHTNMAKAALNMMTRTSAQEFAEHNIYMNAVDTGWINDENPVEKAATIMETANFQTPIDETDAMARILDPILVGVRTGVVTHGQFYKDYHVTEW